MAEKAPVTAAIRALRAAGVDFSEHLYPYVEHGGTKTSSEALGVPEHQVIKTLVMETAERKPLIVLMHGDKKVSTRELARQLGERGVTPCSPEVAQKHTGYLVGGTSPFGLRRAMPVYVERSILALERILLNGGKRGFLVALAPETLVRTLDAKAVDVAIDP